MKDNKNIVIVTHQNVIRVLLKNIVNLSDENFIDLEIPACLPIVIEFNSKLDYLKHYPLF